MCTGGYHLVFDAPADAQQAYDEAALQAKARAASLTLFGSSEHYGSWSEGLACKDRMLVVDEDSELHRLEYDLASTSSGDTLFQRICMKLAFSLPEVSFRGACTYRTDGRDVGIPAGRGSDSPVTQTIDADYNGRALTFRIRLTLELPDGTDITVQRQRWEHNDWGFLVRRLVTVPSYVADHQALLLSGLVERHVRHPWSQHADFFRDLAFAARRGEVSCAGETTEGLLYGCTLLERMDGSFLPMVCLNDPRGREVLVASASAHEDGRCDLPDWVVATSDGSLLVWKTAGIMYLWDGILVRRVVDG